MGDIFVEAGTSVKNFFNKLVTKEQSTNKELQIQKDILVYPLQLRDMILKLDSIGTEKPIISFVEFSPLVETIKIPTVKEFMTETTNPKTKKTMSKKETTVSVEIKKQKLAIDSIILPIKPIEDTLDGSWSPIEGMGFGSYKDYFQWKLMKGLTGVASTILPQEVVIAMKQGVFGSAIDNPHEKLMFSGNTRRSFSIGWNFMKPRNRNEERLLVLIANLLRIGSIGTYGKMLIYPPITWSVKFHSLPDYPSFLRYDRCGFASVAVKFGGSGDNFNAMSSGFPFLSITINVNELEFPTRESAMIAPMDVSMFKDVAITPAELEAIQKDMEQNYKGVQQDLGENK